MPIASVLHILQTIKDRGPISRTDLQHVTSLSWGTITNTTRELLNRKFIQEQGALSTKAGRKPVQLALNLQTHCLLGLEILPDHTYRAIAMDLAGNINWHQAAPLFEASPEGIGSQLAETLRRGLAATGNRASLGAGIVLPADPCQASFPRADTLRNTMSAHLQMPVVLEHPANALALAHRWFGQTAAADCDDFICVHLGDSIELGIIAGGDIFRCHTGAAGRLAHIALDPAGPRCVCGNRGCVHTYCSLPALLAAAQDGAGVQAPQSLAELVARAQAGQPHALAACARLGTQLGTAILWLADLYDPAFLVLTGKTAAAAPHFMPALQTRLALRPVPPQVLLSPFTADAPAMGVCALVLQNAFDAQMASQATRDAEVLPVGPA